MSTEDRRAPGATRMPFDALVEVGGALGPTFEAQAVNVSEEGIHLRTAYLPEAGQTLTCRFDAGPAHNVLASGEVVWAQGDDSGGEFGVRFTDVDMESIEALKTVCGVPGHAPVVAGSKVRLHIDGLASPMRAKIRDAHSSAVTVGSDLGFLQVGRPLELEDAQSGQKRPANIDRVDVVVDPTSHVPQLVVTLRYSDAPALDGSAPARESAVTESPASAPAPEPWGDDAVATQMKGAFARAVAGIGPTLGRLAERTKTMAILLAKRSAGPEKDGPGVRRTTAPPPGGGLHASGRKVVRGEATSSHDIAVPAFKVPMNRRNRMVLGGAVLVVAVVGALAIKKGRHESDQTAAPGASVAANVAAPSPPPPATPDPTPVPPPVAPAAPPSMAGSSADETADSSKASQKKHARVAPFANGPVHHGNVLHLKMDGPVESIEGAQQPTGFTVKMPGRKSLEAAAPLAARDSRIAAIRVSNDSEGAELTVAFKDGVPNYRVSAKGDTLIIALGTPGPVEPTAEKRDDKSPRIAKRGKHAVPSSPGQPESRSGTVQR